jgi:alkylhydroperoxidase family enzyme
VSAPHDVPGVAQLIQAVREWIERDVTPNSEGRLRFHARVAANALSIVERELRLGPEQIERHRERLERLGFDDDAALAAAIRSGALDDRWDEVASTVRETVQDKLRVANPRYLT